MARQTLEDNWSVNQSAIVNATIHTVSGLKEHE